MTIAPVAGVDAALAAVNDSRFGLQAGIFTHDLQIAFRAHRELVSRWRGDRGRAVVPRRSDALWRGQVVWAWSGGLRAAMTDLTHDRVMVLTGLDL
jgi:hypothetical protein